VTLGGSLLVNGSPIKPDDMVRISGFVHQQDVIMDTMTVREVSGAASNWRKGPDRGDGLQGKVEPAHADAQSRHENLPP